MTRDQQKRLNAMCGDLAKQVPWTINRPSGPERRLIHRDDWRHIWAGIELGESYFAHPEEPGRFVTRAASSRELSVEQASNVIERIAAFGADQGVQFSDPKESALREQYEREVASV